MRSFSARRPTRLDVLANISIGVALACLSASCSAQTTKQTTNNTDEREPGILHVRGNVYMLAGETANVTVQAGEEGVLLVDTMMETSSEQLIKAVQSLSDKPVRHIVNTHSHPDHIGGNAAVSKAGDTLFNRNQAGTDEGEGGAPIYSHENVLNTISLQELPLEAWPTSTYFTASKDLYFNGEAVRIFHQPNAHTDGDSIVFFRGSDVISAGDIFITTGYPYIDVENGGTIDGIIAALNRIIELAVPAALQEGGTLIVPGHGRLCDESEVVEYRDMLTIIRSMIQERINEGLSLDEVLAARPTFGFDVRYGADSGFWTTNQFVEAIYNELARPRVN
jgi:glyoxylase-like metal-dependent hydrolase (beta-lactamase superfamily II)